MIKCSVCKRKYHDMTEETLEMKFRYFTGPSHQINNAGDIHLCVECAGELLSTDNTVANIINDGF